MKLSKLYSHNPRKVINDIKQQIKDDELLIKFEKAKATERLTIELCLNIA